MDWYSWLSKSSLEPHLVYEYSLLFSNNELEEDDINHFDHDFLQSMGISIAKHRLEILKLAKKERSNSPRPVSRLLAAIDKAKKCIANYIRSLVNRDSSAIVVVPRPPPYYSGAVPRGTMLKRNKKPVKMNQGGLLLTDGGVRVPSPITVSRKASPMVYRYKESEKGGDGDAHRLSGGEEIRWDSMFQDMRPT